MANYGTGPYGAGFYGIGGTGGAGSPGTFDVGTYDTATFDTVGSTTGTGVLGVPPIGLSGSGTATNLVVTGSGILVLRGPTISGAGGLPAGAATGSGVLGVPPIGLQGTGNTTSVTVTGSGVLTLRGPTINGAGGQPSVVIVIPPQVGINGPLAVVEVAFSSNPNTTPIWVDITPYVQGFSYSRGRQRELDQIQAGTLQVQIYAPDRRFDPTYTGSPYYPNVLPMRRIRVRSTFGGSSYTEYTGYVESWGEAWPSWQDTEVTVTASDALKPINLTKLNTTYPQQTSDQRVTAVLGTINWTIGGPAWTLGVSTLGVTTVAGPTGDRIVTPGTFNVAASVLTDVSALQHLQDVTVAESGMLFANVEGALTFYGAQRLYSPSGLVSQATFGELEYPYADITMSYDDTDIWNDVRVTATGGVEQVASDATSQAQYYTRTLALSTLNVSNADATDLGQRLLAQWKQPGLQIQSITLDGAVDPLNIYPQMLGRELGDHVTVRRRPPGGGTPIEQVSVIQGIDTTFSAEGGIWSTIWRLSPASATTYWVLDDPTYSLLGTTSRLF